MFLIERLVGVGTYSLTLILICLSLVNATGKQIKRRLNLYIIILSIMAFLYVPYETADLYRIYRFVNDFPTYSFSQLWEEKVLNSEVRYASILYWAIGKTGIPQLLPALTTFVCYSCIFYIIYKTSEKNQISGKNVAITLLFYMSLGSYVFVISGIRCMLGISLLSFCFYRENVENKFNILHIPLYIIATLIHAFAAVLIMARFVIPIFDTKTTAVRKLMYFIFLAVGAFIVANNFSDYIGEIIEKADSFLSGNIYSYIWDYIIGFIVVFVLVSIILRCKKIEEYSFLKLNVFRWYITAVLFVALCLCFEFSIFHRTVVYLLPIISLPMLMTILQTSANQQIEDNTPTLGKSIYVKPITFNSMIVVLSLLLLLLSCSRGSLSALKFFEL